MLPRSFVLCGACVSATGRRSFVLPRSCLVVRGPATLPLVASEREGLGPWGLPPVSVLRPVTRYARGAWGCVRCSTGLVGQRDSSSAGARRSVWRATRRQLFVGIRVLLIADGSSFGVRHVSPDQFAQRSGPRCGLTSSCSFALAHCESCTARRVAVELKRSRHDSASISKVLESCCGPRVEGSSTGGGTELQQETASTVLPREAR